MKRIESALPLKSGWFPVAFLLRKCANETAKPASWKGAFCALLGSFPVRSPRCCYLLWFILVLLQLIDECSTPCTARLMRQGPAPANFHQPMVQDTDQD